MAHTLHPIVRVIAPWALRENKVVEKLSILKYVEIIYVVDKK